MHVKESVSSKDYVERRHEQGIYWSHLPSLNIVTPKGNYFPIPEHVNLGDRETAKLYIEEHLLNFTKGLLEMPELNVQDHEYQNRRDFDALDRLANTRTLTKKQL